MANKKNNPTTISYPSILFAGFLCSAISCGDRQAATRTALKNSQSAAESTALSTVPKKLENDVVKNEGGKAQIILDFWNIVAAELNTQLGDALQHKHRFGLLQGNATPKPGSDSFKSAFKSYLSTFGQQGFKGEARAALTALNNLSDSRSVKKGLWKRIKLQEDKTDKKKNLLVAKALQHIVDIQNELTEAYSMAEKYVKSLNIQDRNRIKDEALKNIGDITAKCSSQLHADFIFSTKKDMDQGLIYDQEAAFSFLAKQEVSALFRSPIMGDKGPILNDFVTQFLIRSDASEESRIILKTPHDNSQKTFSIYARFLDLLDAAQQGPEAFLACMQKFKATKGSQSTNTNVAGDMLVCKYKEYELADQIKIATKAKNGNWIPTEETKKLTDLLAKLRPYFASEKYLGTCVRYSDLQDRCSGFNIDDVRTFVEESARNLRGTLLLDPKYILGQTDVPSAWKDATGWEMGPDNRSKLEKLSQAYKK